MSSRRQSRFGMFAFVTAISVVTSCGESSLTGDEDDDIADGEVERDGGTDDAGDGPYFEDRTDSEDVARDEGGPGDDADGSPSDIIGIEPEGIDEFIVPSDGEGISPHRHALPAAFRDGVYGLVIDVDRGTDGLVIGLYRFDSDARELHRVWLDEPGATTEYNSICWSGEAFVAALPTSRVGVRIGAFRPDGTMVRDPVVIEPDPGYSPASAGQPPTVLCGDEGPFVIDHGRGEGGTDRIYVLTPDGGYGGLFHDTDLPAIATTLYYVSSPCAATGAEVACATHDGLVFVRRDGSYRLSDAVAPGGICPPGLGCDVARTVDGLAAGWLAMAADSLALTLARFSVGGSLEVPPVRGAQLQWFVSMGIRMASSGTTVLAAAPPSDSGAGLPIYLHLFDTSGVAIGASIPVSACDAHVYPPDECPATVTGRFTTPLFWEGDVYAALWVPGGPWSSSSLVYRRYRLIER